MILKQVQVTAGDFVKVKLPAGSVPCEFKRQTKPVSGVYLWYLDSGSTSEKEIFSFQFARKGQNVQVYKSRFGSLQGPVIQIFQL